MFPTMNDKDAYMLRKFFPRRNPLKSGQCFLLIAVTKRKGLIGIGRNPLKSGQCFLPTNEARFMLLTCPTLTVAIPSNRVNVSYIKKGNIQIHLFADTDCRNPLKSGQCFLPTRQRMGRSSLCPPCRNPLKSGQCFLLPNAIVS